ncbi:zinc finger, CCHC-type containing protein [Tanacetum coccineum]
MTKGETSTPTREQNIALQCPKLNASNYTTWAIMLETILKAYGLWETLEATEKVDERKIHTTKAMILTTLPEDILMQVAQYETAKEVWESIKVRYIGEERVQKARIQTLRSELETLKMKNNETKFLPIVASIEQYSEIDEMSFEEAMGRIITFEERIKSQDKPEENYQNKLLMARSSNQNHGNGRGRNFSKEEKGRGTSFQQSTREQIKNKMRCYECGDLDDYRMVEDLDLCVMLARARVWQQVVAVAKHDDKEDQCASRVEDSSNTNQWGKKEAGSSPSSSETADRIERRLAGWDRMGSPKPGWSRTPTILFPSGFRARTRHHRSKRKPVHSHSTPQTSTVDPKRAAFEEEIDKLKREKTSLEKNLIRYKQQQPASKLQLEDLTQRVNSMEQRQDALLTFLKKAAQNPNFVTLLRNLSPWIFQQITRKEDCPSLGLDSSYHRLFQTLTLFQTALKAPMKMVEVHNSDHPKAAQELQRRHLNDTIPQSLEDIGKPPSENVPSNPKPTNNAAPAAPTAVPTRVNDVFWEQFLTERPGSSERHSTNKMSEDRVMGHMATLVTWRIWPFELSLHVLLTF